MARAASRSAGSGLERPTLQQGATPQPHSHTAHSLSQGANTRAATGWALAAVLFSAGAANGATQLALNGILRPRGVWAEWRVPLVQIESPVYLPSRQTQVLKVN